MSLHTKRQANNDMWLRPVQTTGSPAYKRTRIIQWKAEIPKNYVEEQTWFQRAPVVFWNV